MKITDTTIPEVKIIEPKEKFGLWNIILLLFKNRMSKKWHPIF